MGREQHGITEALKPKLKFDNSGIGHDPAKEFTHSWWSEAYNSAASNITVTEATDGCQLVAKPKMKKKKKKKTLKSMYSNFVTGGMLVGNQLTGGGSDGEAAEETAGEDSADSHLSDEQLLQACGGRTAHKGARHGHKMDGKLARIMAQEAAILAKLQNGKNDQKNVIQKKKKRKHVEEEDSQSADAECEVSNGEAETEKKMKKKKKKRCETVAGELSTNDENAACDPLPERKKKKKRKAERDS